MKYFPITKVHHEQYDYWDFINKYSNLDGVKTVSWDSETSVAAAIHQAEGRFNRKQDITMHLINGVWIMQ